MNYNEMSTMQILALIDFQNHKEGQYYPVDYYTYVFIYISVSFGS